VFIEGALPGEVVEYAPFKKKDNFEQANATCIIKQSFLRTIPKCRYFGLCGGCSMQHLEEDAQVAAKQRVLEDNLRHIGKVTPESILPAIHGQAWEYRHRARLSVRFVQKKGKVLIGFHEKRSSFVADMSSCEVLPARLSKLIDPLRNLVGAMSIRERLPQIEIALGQNVDVMVIRNLDALTDQDETLLKSFAEQHRIQFFLQPKGPETARPFWPIDAPELTYAIPEFDIVMPYHPTEFTQVNPAINRVLVRRALALLNPQPGERIADLFCGLGNFTLPIARKGAQVLGIEGSEALVRRARANADRNGLGGQATFLAANLFETTDASLAALGTFDKMLIDPPRDGAIEVVKAIGQDNGPHGIVYVSCNPATLARDAAVLVNTKGYRLKAAGVVNMFPHTAHVESIALFEK
jgi:23S rRNA (uracil1939-C5)-methyltransferase